MGKIIEIKEKSKLESLIEKKDNIIIVDFWAEWCGPCRLLSKQLEKVAEETSDNIIIAKINVEEEENRDLVSEYKIRSIPAVFLYKEGEKIHEFTGLKQKEDIINIINND